MNKNKFILFLLIAFLFSSCEKEDEIKFTVFTGETAYTNDDAIIFNGRIQMYKDETILDHGFIIYDSLGIDNPEVVSLGPMNESGNFTHKSYSGLKPGAQYRVAAFAKNRKDIIIGEKNCFAIPQAFYPVVDRVEPDSGYFTDTISIYGHKLSNLIGDWELLLGQERPLPFEKSDTLLKIMVPIGLNQKKSELILRYDDMIIHTEKYFSIFDPVFDSICPTQAYSGEIVKIFGKYLGNYKVSRLYVNDNLIISQCSNNLISFNFPIIKGKEFVNIKLKVLKRYYTVTDTFKCLVSDVNSVDKVNVSFNDIVLIKRENFYTANSNQQ